MATYKGIGYDSANGRTRTGTSSDDISYDSLITATDGVNVTAVGLTVGAGGANVTGGTTSDTLTVTGDASVGGDLTVTGDIISRGAVNLVVNDNFIDLNFANSTTTSEAGGLTVQMNRNSAFTASTVTTFVAGSAGVSNPTFTATDAGSSSLLAAGDVVVMTGATQEGNNGLYVVSAVNQASFPQIVTIKGIGTVAVNAATPWAQNQFEAESGASASAFKTDIFIQLVADGTTAFTDAAGSAYNKGTFLTAYHANATETSFSNDGGYTTVESTLQSAYNGGNTITTAGSNPVAITLAADAAGFSLQGSSAGDGNVSIGGTTAVNAFVVGASGAASSITSTGQSLTLQTATSGALAVTSAATLAVTGAGQSDFGDDTGVLRFDGSGNLSDNALVSMNISTSGLIAFTSGGGTACTIGDGTGAIQLDGSGDLLESGLVNTNLTGSGTMTLTGGGLSKFGDDTATWDFDGAGAVSETGMTTFSLTPSSTVDIDCGGGVTIDPTGAFLVGDDGTCTGVSAIATGGNIQLETATSGAISFVSVAGLSSTGTTYDIDVTSNLTIDASTVSIGGDNDTGDITVKSQTGDIIIAAETSSKAIIIDSAFPQLVKPFVSGEAITAGQAVYGTNAGGSLKVSKTDADAMGTSQFIGIAVSTAGGADAAIDILFAGVANAVTSADTFNAANHLGKPVYLSTTVGLITATPPTGSGDVVYQVGLCVGGTGTTWQVMIQPSFVMEIG